MFHICIFDILIFHNVYGICTMTQLPLLLANVIGMLYGVGSEREYERNGAKTKLNVISLETDGYKHIFKLFLAKFHFLSYYYVDI